MLLLVRPNVKSLLLLASPQISEERKAVASSGQLSDVRANIKIVAAFGQRSDVRVNIKSLLLSIRTQLSEQT